MKATEALTRALLALVEDDDPGFKQRALEVVLTANRQYPVRFIGDLAVLNPVVDAILEQPAYFETLKVIVDARRAEAHKLLMFGPPDPLPFDKLTSQRNLMRERRLRSNRARQIENAVRHERNKLRGNARIEFERRVLAAWGAQLEEQLNSAREYRGGTLSKAQIDNVRARFWAKVDKELSQQEDDLRRRGKL